jgi:solute carrier family 45 protein 1/2/4
MSPSLISLVWLSGPLSGMFIQPYIGVLSDNCTFRWGRRKTFIVFGTIATSIFMVALPWASNMVEFLFSALGSDPSGSNAKGLTKCVAALIISILKISLQPVQCGIRALIVDCCPEEQQLQASAYASRVIGIGSIIGYCSGFVDFPSMFPFLGNTQFQVLCVLCCICLVLTVVLQCTAIHEKRLEYIPVAQRSKDLGLFAPLKQGFQTAATMPKRIRRICIVQFFSWLSWFSFMYYITT